MNNINPNPGNAPVVSDPITCLLDAMDQLGNARALSELIGMAVRKSPTREENAISVGAEATLRSIEASLELLTHIQGEFRAGRLAWREPGGIQP